MHFAWDAEQQTFRSTVRAFLVAHLPKDWESLAHGPASEAQSAFSRKFCGELAEAGLLVPHWPTRWGGRDAGAWTSFILAEEMWEAGEPRGGQYMNVNWIGPTLMRFGSEEQQARYIPPMARGETIWCQGFSEPEAGSDLASLRTRAEKQGSSYRINGQKIWTSYAQHAETCFLLARTAPGRDGISVFLVPMGTPGIIVREIPSLIGEGDIHEVFWDNVEVPASALLGAEGQAWEIARTSLSLERVGIPRFALATKMLHRAVRMLEQAGALRLWRDRAGCPRARGLRGGTLLQLRHRRSKTTWNADGPRGERRPIRNRHGRARRARVRGGACAGSVVRRRGHAARTSSARHRRRHSLRCRRDSTQYDRHRSAQAAAGAALMDFRLTADQSALAEAIDKLAVQFEAKPTEFRGFALLGQELDKELEEGQYFDIAQVPELGALGAAMAVERLARVPFAAEFALSMLVRPELPGEWPRPLAVIDNGRPGRFVATARTLLVIEGDRIGLARPAANEVEPVESLFAYPMGRWKGGARTTQLSGEEAANVRKWLRVALASEASGLAHAALASAVDHLTQRKQFGRPLGAFQALRHRMAECAVLAGGVRWLALKAADTADPGDAALAALHAQESATRIVYDMHQMLGAMGMTLEHPLHLWTYRLKALLSDLGGRGGQALAVAEECFGDAPAALSAVP